MNNFDHRTRAKQLISFEGMSYERGITPTDIDGMIDFGGKGLVLIELKYDLTEIKTGQRLAIENLIDTFEKTGKKALGIVAMHRITDCETDVVMAKCEVVELRYNFKWWPCWGTDTVKEIIDRWRKKVSV